MMFPTLNPTSQFLAAKNCNANPKRALAAPQGATQNKTFYGTAEATP
jgi:hypothetical protein